MGSGCGLRTARSTPHSKESNTAASPASTRMQFTVHNSLPCNLTRIRRISPDFQRHPAFWAEGAKKHGRVCGRGSFMHSGLIRKWATVKPKSHSKWLDGFSVNVLQRDWLNDLSAQRLDESAR